LDQLLVAHCACVVQRTSSTHQPQLSGSGVNTHDSQSVYKSHDSTATFDTCTGVITPVLQQMIHHQLRGGVSAIGSGGEDNFGRKLGSINFFLQLATTGSAPAAVVPNAFFRPRMSQNRRRHHRRSLKTDRQTDRQTQT